MLAAINSWIESRHGRTWLLAGAAAINLIAYLGHSALPEKLTEWPSCCRKKHANKPSGCPSMMGLRCFPWRLADCVGGSNSIVEARLAITLAKTNRICPCDFP